MAPSATQQDTQPGTGWYVYGILPADVELTTEMSGVGNPPGQVQLVRSGDLAALVSEVDLSGQLGSPDDLTVHKEILDSSAAGVPILPLRFGAVLTSEDAVAEELLDAHHDTFVDVLSQLEDRVQYVVKGRYAEAAILGEILGANPGAARLREQIQGADPDATRDARIQLGELINQEVSARREADTGTFLDAMAGHYVAAMVREPTHELDAVHVALLVEAGQQDDVGGVTANLAEDWTGRIELRLLGPMAAYDFVGPAAPEG